MNVFPFTPPTDTEIDIVASKLSDPAVQKYLHMLAHKAGVAIVTAAPADGESAEEFLRKQARVAGHIECIDALLSIKVPEPVVQE